MHHGFTDSHMSSASRRLTAYVEGSHMGEEVGRNPHVTYASRVTLMPSRSFIPPGPPPEVSAALRWCEPRFGSARRAPARICGLCGAESARPPCEGSSREATLGLPSARPRPCHLATAEAGERSYGNPRAAFLHKERDVLVVAVPRLMLTLLHPERQPRASSGSGGLYVVAVYSLIC